LDNCLNLRYFDLSDDTPEGNLSFKLEDLSFFEWSVVFQPVIDGLEEFKWSDQTKCPMERLTDILASHFTSAALLVDMISGPQSSKFSCWIWGRIFLVTNASLVGLSCCSCHSWSND